MSVRCFVTSSDDSRQQGRRGEGGREGRKKGKKKKEISGSARSEDESENRVLESFSLRSIRSTAIKEKREDKKKREERKKRSSEESLRARSTSVDETLTPASSFSVEGGWDGEEEKK